MKKKLFKNYNYSFDSNEKKVLSNFCKQSVQAMSSDDRFNQDKSTFQSILSKLNSNEDPVKLTKNETIRLTLQLKENIKHFEKEKDKSWFIKKWMIKSMLNQYRAILNTHFSE